MEKPTLGKRTRERKLTGIRVPHRKGVRNWGPELGTAGTREKDLFYFPMFPLLFQPCLEMRPPSGWQ